MDTIEEVIPIAVEGTFHHHLHDKENNNVKEV